MRCRRQSGQWVSGGARGKLWVSGGAEGKQLISGGAGGRLCVSGGTGQQKKIIVMILSRPFLVPFLVPAFLLSQVPQKIALSKSFPMSYRKSLRGVHIRSLFTTADHTHVLGTGPK